MSSELATEDARPARSHLTWPPWAVSISVAVVFFLAAQLSLALLDKADGVAVFWPAAGVASGFLVAFGPTARWPVVIGVVAATFAANLLGDRNLPALRSLQWPMPAEPVLVCGAHPALLWRTI